MRRASVVIALVLAVASAGCAGADGQKAQELLAQSDQALAQVESFHFAGRMWMRPLWATSRSSYAAGETRRTAARRS